MVKFCVIQNTGQGNVEPRFVHSDCLALYMMAHSYIVEWRLIAHGTIELDNEPLFRAGPECRYCYGSLAQPAQERVPLSD